MATGINNLVSYDLNGVKESFANWISNISPSDTPFTSMTGKESVQNKFFNWQEDALSAVADNAYAEGSDAASATLAKTHTRKNVTQILRKVVQVSDTANALSSYGRGKEMQYQMEKAAKELKRDIEFALLHNVGSSDGAKAADGSDVITQARTTAGFRGLVAVKGAASDEDPLAIVHDDVATAGTLTEGDIFKITNALYLAGAKATHIMFHPKYAQVFSGLMEKVSGTGAATRVRMFDGAVDAKVNKFVGEMVDPLGQRFVLLPNRFMPKEAIYFFNPGDWTQMVLRQPGAQLLAKTGSFDKYMLEIELGLRHRNQYASGVLVVGVAASNVVKPTGVTITGTGVAAGKATLASTTATLKLNANVAPATATDKTVTWSSAAESVATVSSAGIVTGVTAGKAVITATANGDSTKTATVEVTVPAAAQTPISVVASGPSLSIYDASSKTATFTGLSDSLILTPTPATATAVLSGTDAAKFQWTAGTKTVALKDDSASASATLTFSKSGNADLVVNLVFTKP